MADTSLVFDVIAKTRGELELKKLGVEVELLERRLRKLDSAEKSASTSALGMGRKFEMAGNGLSSMATAAVALGPALLPVLGGATVAAGGLSTALVAGGAAFGVFGLAAAGHMTELQKAIKEVAAKEKSLHFAVTAGSRATATKKLAIANRDLEKSLGPIGPAYLKMSLAYHAFQDQTRKPVMAVFAKAMTIAAAVLPKLKPLFDVGAKAAGAFLQTIDRFVKSGGFDAMVKFLAGQAGPALSGFGMVLLNLARGMGGLLTAFAPVSQGVVSGLAGMTAAFAKWATGLSSSDGFAGFIAYVKANGPAMVAVAMAIGAALVNMLKGIAPLAPVALGILKTLASAVAAVPPEVIGALASGFIAAAVAIKLVSVAMGILNVVMDANPIGIIVVAVAALAAGIIYLWKNSQTFRVIMVTVFSVVGQAVLTFVKFSLTAFHVFFTGVTKTISFILHAGASVGLFSKGTVKAFDSFARTADLTFTVAQGKLNQWSTSLKNAPKVMKLQGDISDLDKKLAAARMQLKTVPPSKRVTLQAKIDNLLAQKAAAQRAIDQLHGKIVPITIQYTRKGVNVTAPSAAARAVGGPVTAGTPYMVGERGPELFVPKTSGRIVANSRLPKTLTGNIVDGLTGSVSRIRSMGDRIVVSLERVFSGSRESALVRYVRREDAALVQLARRRDSVTVKLKATNQRLTDLKAASAQLATSVRDNLLQGGAIAGEASIADVVGKLQGQVRKVRHFRKDLSFLAGRGLSKDLLRQLAEGGVDQGGVTAEALRNATKGQIGQINTLQLQLGREANRTGNFAGTQFYGAGISAARGLIKGLASQRHSIEKLMLTIAQGMQSAIRRALGIRSPSAVMAALGRHAGAGLVAGLDGTRGAVEAASGRLASAVAGPIGGFAGAGGSGRRGGQAGPVYVTVNMPAGSDGEDVVRAVQRYASRNGGIRIKGGVTAY